MRAASFFINFITTADVNIMVGMEGDLVLELDMLVLQPFSPCTCPPPAKTGETVNTESAITTNRTITIFFIYSSLINIFLLAY